jgi:AcrR family transcriptional regulator
MKCDLSKKQTLGAKRTLKNLKSSMVSLLSRKAFEQIQVTEICEKAMIPKSTFYNYFEDKYDLLTFVITDLLHDLYPQVKQKQDQSLVTEELIDRVIDIVTENDETLRRILRYNRADRHLQHEFQRLSTEIALLSLQNCTQSEKYDLPFSIVSRVNANAFLIVFTYVYIEGNNLSRDEIKSWIIRLLYPTKQ